MSSVYLIQCYQVAWVKFIMGKKLVFILVAILVIMAVVSHISAQVDGEYDSDGTYF